MLKDTRIILSICGFLLFLAIWVIMDYCKITDADPLLKFAEESCMTCFTAICLFVKTDGQYEKKQSADIPPPSITQEK